MKTRIQSRIPADPLDCRKKARYWARASINLAMLFILSLGSCTQASAEIIENNEHSSKSESAKSSPDESSKEKDDSARKLLEKTLAAMGGSKNLVKLFNTPLRASGKLEQISPISGTANLFDCELVSLGKKQKITVTYMGQKVITSFDGENCWIKQGDYVHRTDTVTSRRIKEDQDHGFLLLYNLDAEKARIESRPARKLDNRVCPAFAIYADDGEATTYYLDPDTWLVSRSEYEGIDIEQGTDCLKAYEYSDWREVLGTKQPFRSTEYSDDKKVGELSLSSIDTSISITADFFEMPVSEKQNKFSNKESIVIPFEYKSNEIVIRASINGGAPRPFLVDTGATQTIIDDTIARDFPNYKPDEISITTGSGAVRMGYLKLEDLTIGDISFDDITAAVADLGKFSQLIKFRPAGLIGANILNRFLVTIDYERKELILADPDNARVPEGAVVVKTKPALGAAGMSVEGILNDTSRITFLIDSGAAFNHVTESLVSELLPGRILPVGLIKGLDGEPVSIGSTQFEKLEIGKLIVEKPVFSVAPSANSKNKKGIISSGNLAIIGNPLLSKYRVTFDYRNQRLFFEKSRQKEQEDLEFRELDTIVKEHLKNLDITATSHRLTQLSARALKAQQPGVAALALAYDALFSSKSGSSLDNAVGNSVSTNSPEKQSYRSFSRAYRLAEKSKSDDAMASVLALWAYWYLQNAKSAEMIDSARPLVGKSLLASPNNANAFAVAGLLILRTNSGLQTVTKSSGAKRMVGAGLSAQILANQALMIDPANWIGLWVRHDAAIESGNNPERAHIADLLRHYWPEAREVELLFAKHSSM